MSEIGISIYETPETGPIDQNALHYRISDALISWTAAESHRIYMFYFMFIFSLFSQLELADSTDVLKEANESLQGHL